MFEIRGKVHRVEAEKKISDSFRKREIVIVLTNEQKPEFSDYISLEATQDKCDLLNVVKPGMEVNVGFFLRGRLWKEGTPEERAFSSLSLFYLDILSEASTSQTAQGVAQQVAPPPSTSAADDDLPF